MGRVLIGALIVGGALRLMLTTITGGAGVFLTARNAKNRSQFLWRFAVAGVIVLTLCVVAANQHPYATVRPGSDYDVALQNLFLQCFGYCASPGTAALVAAMTTWFAPRKKREHLRCVAPDHRGKLGA